MNDGTRHHDSAATDDSRAAEEAQTPAGTRSSSGSADAAHVAAIRSLIRDVLTFAWPRAARAGVLLGLGSVLEVVGVVFLIPIVQILLSDGSGPGALAGRALDAIGISGQKAQIGVLLLFFLCLIAIRFVIIFQRDAELSRLRVDFVANVRRHAFVSLASLPWSEIAGRGRGRIGHALVRDVDRVSDTVGLVLNGIVSLVQIAIQLCVSLVLAPLITVGVILLGGAGFLALGTLRRRNAERRGELTEADYELYNTTTGYLRGLKAARAHGLEPEYATVFDAAVRRVTAELLRQERAFTLGRISTQALVAAVGLAAVAAGVFLVPIAPERLIVAILILARLSGPLQILQNAAQHIGFAAAAYRSVFALTGKLRSAAPARMPRPVKRLERAPAIRFRHVSLATDGSELLTGIDCDVPAGRVTMLTGPSGAGKSLFCDLAVGLLAPQSGRIEIDGQPLDDATLARLRASLSYVTQEGLALEDSLRANLIWGCGDVRDEEIWRALDAVGATALARGLADGLDGPLHAAGARFSGGERQRFRLAHAMLRRPDLLVLDEATNALDEAAELAVLKGLRDGLAQATVLLVTHRRSILTLADNLLVIRGGRLVWSGPPSGVDPSRL